MKDLRLIDCCIFILVVTIAFVVGDIQQRIIAEKSAGMYSPDLITRNFAIKQHERCNNLTYPKLRRCFEEVETVTSNSCFYGKDANGKCLYLDYCEGKACFYNAPKGVWAETKLP